MQPTARRGLGRDEPFLSGKSSGLAAGRSLPARRSAPHSPISIGATRRLREKRVARFGRTFASSHKGSGMDGHSQQRVDKNRQTGRCRAARRPYLLRRSWPLSGYHGDCGIYGLSPLRLARFNGRWHNSVFDRTGRSDFNHRLDQTPTASSAKRNNRHGFAFPAGLAVALWSANAGVKALFDALNVAYEVAETRGCTRPHCDFEVSHLRPASIGSAVYVRAPWFGRGCRTPQPDRRRGYYGEMPLLSAFNTLAPVFPLP